MRFLLNKLSLYHYRRMSDKSRLEAAKRLTDPFFHDSLKLGNNWRYYVTPENVNRYFEHRNATRIDEDLDQNLYKHMDFRVNTYFSFCIQYETKLKSERFSWNRKKTNEKFAKLINFTEEPYIDESGKEHRSMSIKYKLVRKGLITTRPLSQKVLAAYDKLNDKVYTMILIYRESRFGPPVIEGVVGDQLTELKDEIKDEYRKRYVEEHDIDHFKAVEFKMINLNLIGGSSKTRRNRKGKAKAKKATRRHHYR
jgi:hypothetical protein